MHLRSTLIILLVAVGAVGIVTYMVGGLPLLLAGLSRSLDTSVRALPLIVVAFAVVGQLGTYLTPARVESILRRHEGMRGLLMTALAGGILPGGPYVFYPLASATLTRWRVPDHLLFSFVAAKHTWDLSRLPLEMSLAGFHLALIRNLLTLPYPLVGALVFRLIRGRDPAAGEAEEG